jgi:hypothetical protein
MERYKNSSGRSNIDSFEIGNDFIKIKFNGTYKVYSYSFGRAGRNHVDNMKSLAIKGSGLNGYINSFVKYLSD